MKKILGALTVTVTLAMQAQAGSHKPLVINGSRLKPTELQAMSNLKGTEHRCTATLIGPKVILTAAHCVNGEHTQNFTLVDGTARTATLTTHPDYKDDNSEINIPYDFAIRNDLAIGILSEEVTHIKPITLTREAPKVEDLVLFAGEGAPTLERMYGFARAITASEIGITIRGFGQNPQIGAPGDSGGPNFVVRENGAVEIYGVSSTSTRLNDWTVETGWEHALPYTQGNALALPKTAEGTLSFVEDFIQKNQLEVCGFNKKCEPVLAPGK